MKSFAYPAAPSEDGVYLKLRVKSRAPLRMKAKHMLHAGNIYNK